MSNFILIFQKFFCCTSANRYCTFFIGLLLIAATFTVDAQITAAVAANMQTTMEELIPIFKQETGISVSPVYEASGRLVIQIKSGAPFDIFLSADIVWPESLSTLGYTQGDIRTYAYGSLVLWTTRNIDLSAGLNILESPSVKSIAIADLLLTAYGPAAKKVMENAGLWSKVKDKCVYGGNISQVAHFIATGSADIGFAAKSAVLSKEMVGKGKWIDLESLSHNLLPQGVVILKHGYNNRHSETDKLYNFLFSKPAREVLIKNGYRLP